MWRSIRQNCCGFGLEPSWFSYLEHFRMGLQGVMPGVQTLWSTYLHLWSALSSSGVSLSKYWNAIFTSSMKSWKIQYPRLKEITWTFTLHYILNIFLNTMSTWPQQMLTTRLQCSVCAVLPVLCPHEGTSLVGAELVESSMKKKKNLLALLNSMCFWIYNMLM